MPKGLKRYYGLGELHFITFSCYRRLPLLGTARARNLFLKELGKVREEYGFLLVGYVVMLNHVHLLISEPKKGTPSTVLQMLKQRVSRKMRKKKNIVPRGQLRIPFPRLASQLPQFWQPRFYDFNVYSHEKKTEKLDYMHANPVNRGLVRHPKGLGMEQLVVLLQKRTGSGAHRYREFMTDQKGKKKPRPHKPRTGHPRNFSSDPDRATRPGLSVD
jgi:putative transposase